MLYWSLKNQKKLTPIPFVLQGYVRSFSYDFAATGILAVFDFLTEELLEVVADGVTMNPEKAKLNIIIFDNLVEIKVSGVKNRHFF